MKTRRETNASAGFSWIEVQLVILITVVLCMIGFSVGKRMIMHSHQSVSMGNLRQWGVALGLYVADHNDRLPRRGQGRQKLRVLDRPEDWFNALPPYLGSLSYQELVQEQRLPIPRERSVFLCPGASMGARVKYPLGYGMNMNLSPWNLPRPSLLSQIHDASNVVFMAEAPGDYSSVYPSAAEYSLIAPHGGKGNVLYLDGRVVCYRADELGCGRGDPRRPGISWKTRTESDANSDLY